MIGNDNHVWTTFWAGNWNSDFFPVPGQAVFDREHQHVAVGNQGGEVFRKLGRLHIVGIAAEAGVAPCGVDRVTPWTPQTAQAGHVTVMQAPAMQSAG